MARLPEGTVTLLFSDVEGSTRLLTRLGPVYADALDRQRLILRQAWSQYGGTELGTEGDSFFVVFPDAPSAVGAAVQAQRDLLAGEWPGGEPLRVRIGVHSGAPMRHGDGYVGMDVHRAARVAAAAHGGQIVVTEATAGLASSMDEVSFDDLGRHSFKDLPHPEHLLQVVAPGLETGFAPPRSLGSAASLPVAATPLVGREDERAHVARLLTSQSTRLVTLTGPGGSGKTRLAMEVAARVVGAFPDGVFFVTLEAVTRTGEFWTGIALALGLPSEADARGALSDRLRHRAILLLLDNLEQVEDCGAAVNDLLASAREVRVLATSRRPLHILGEQEFPVAPLPLPQGDTEEEVSRSAAVEFFVQQCRLVKPSFTLTGGNAATVAALCRRLDGLPLALELAAARSKLLTPQSMLSHLDRALDLHASTTGRSPRQQTLRGTIAWSYDLLDPAAQRLFRCCAVFPGGASLEAVDAVWTAIEQNEEEAVDDVLQRLLDASMVTVAEADDGSSRIEILNTVREYAEERLCASSDDAVVRRAALHFFRGLMWAGIHDQSPGAWTALSGRLIVELDNFRAGLRWLLLPSRSPDADDVSEACLITWGLTNWLLWQRSFRQEGIFWCEQALAASGQAQTVEVAACRAALGRLLTLEGKVEAAQTAVLSAAERLATLTSRTGLRPEDVNLIEWLAQGTRASVAGHLGHLDQGERLLRELTTVAAHPRLRAWNLIRLGHIRRGQGDFDEALELDTEAYELALREAEETLVSMAGAALAYDLKFMGRLEEADALMRSLIPRMLTSAGREDLLIELAEDFGAILAERGRATGAAVLWGAAWAERNRRSLSLHPEQEQQLSHSLALARTALGATWDEWLQRGRELELAQALRQALDDGAGTDT